MLLGDFKNELRLAMKRGSSMDDQLDGFVRRAVRWIEQNYTLQYMRRVVRLVSVAGDDTIELPEGVAVKTIEYLRFTGSDGTRIECRKGDLSDRDSQWTQLDRYSAWPTRTLNPSVFWLDGVNALVFDRMFTESLTGIGLMAQYSDFPRQDHHTHWLLDNAEGLLLRQCMVEFLLSARDDRAAQAYMLKRQEDVQVLLNADQEMKYTGQDLGQGL